MNFINNTHIDFIGKRRIFFFISVFLLVVSLGAYILKGPNYGIDFTGGMLIQISFDNNVKLQDVRGSLESAGLSSFELQTADKTVMVRAKGNIGAQQEFENKITSALSSAFKGNKLTVEKVEYVGPSVGEYISNRAVLAFLLAFLGMIVYVAFRFKSTLWGVAGVAGIIHDVVITFGMVMLVSKEIDVIVIAALLTVAGYSINDTIVLFDRIRENLRLSAKENFATIINNSINQVLLRTVVTTVTVFIVACALFFLGGDVLHTFAYIMVIGTVLGAYSTIFICAPLVYEWETRKRKRAQLSK
ncbi:protein translocase subunit SecF [Endomicrobium proavitum]|uniref:Protein-export membrane protein SecF n=1 Tax=Endomicrobium proavitum TaxID=1408281 RepID=A0A0G3WGX8_9BACT|nr:protein translocase subunit SecF [Endomicrobium proavitum]AKL97926.1 Protein translocase subunit SecF [Endomicrobium proavitum]